MQPTVPSDNSTPESLSTEANDTTVFDALLKEESEPLSTDEHARVLGSFGNLLRASRVSPETASWCASRGLESTTAKEFGAVYLPEKVVTLDDAQAVADQLGVEIAALIRTGILLRRKLKPFIAPRLTGTKDDLDTDTTDRRRKLDRFRFVHGGRVAYPLRDLEGHVRGLKSRAVHGDLRAAAGDYDLEETDPPDAKYLHSKRPVREKRAFQLLFSPALIEVIGGSITAAEARTPQNLKDRRSLWITEGDVDCMLAAQAGALSVGLGGCESHEGQVVEIMRALEEAAKQYLSIDPVSTLTPGDGSEVGR